MTDFYFEGQLFRRNFQKHPESERWTKGVVFLRQIATVNIVIFYVCRSPLCNGVLWTHLKKEKEEQQRVDTFKKDKRIKTILSYRYTHRLRDIVCCPQ